MRKDVNRIHEYIEQHLDEPKYLSDWCQELNQILGKNRGVTKRELAYIFNRLTKNVFEMEYNPSPIQYAFSQEL